MASLVEEHRLQAYEFSGDGSRALKDTGSVAVLLRLSRSKACGIVLDPRPGIKPVSIALAGRFLTTGPPGKSRRQAEKKENCLFVLVVPGLCTACKLLLVGVGGSSHWKPDGHGLLIGGFSCRDA